MSGHRPQLVLVAAVLLLGVASPASAASPGYTEVSISATVTGSSVRASVTVRATETTVVQRFGICVRDASGAGQDFAPKQVDATITTTGTDYTSSRTFSPGRYAYFPCIRADGQWSEIGARKEFVVSAGTPDPPTSKLLFEDDFTGPAGSDPDPQKWRDYSGCTNAKQAFGLIRCGADEKLTGSGQLSVPASPTWGSGLTTAGKFGFSYGIASAWIKIPKTTGYWPAFWTENRPADFHDVPLYGEMDAMEAYTWEPQYVHGGGMHAWAAAGQSWGGDDNYCTAHGVGNFGDGFHKYSVKFEPDRVTGYIDDVQCGAPIVKSADPAKPWPFPPNVNLQNYLILDLAVGGAGGRQPTPPKADVMLVDRVEVRSL